MNRYGRKRSPKRLIRPGGRIKSKFIPASAGGKEAGKAYNKQVQAKKKAHRRGVSAVQPSHADRFFNFINKNFSR